MVDRVMVPDERLVERIRHCFIFGTRKPSAIVRRLQSEGVVADSHFVVITVNRILAERRREKDEQRGKAYNKYSPRKKIATLKYHLGKPESGEICPVCLKPLVLFSSHHVIPRSQGGKDDSRNIIHMCGDCHDILESYTDRGIYYSPELVKQIQLMLLR